MEKPWYAISTRHQHEKAVAQILSQKGLETFLPLHTATRRRKDRTVQLSLPLISCYVFIRGLPHPVLPVLTTPGVHGIVTFGAQPAVIPNEEIDALRRVIENSVRAEPHPFLKCGDRVRVTVGPLEGIEGILVRKKNLFRLILSVEMLQKSVAVEVDAYSVERVGGSFAGGSSRWLPASAPTVA